MCSNGAGPMNASPTVAPLLLEWHTGPPIADSVVREFAKPKRIEAAGTLAVAPKRREGVHATA